MSQVELSVSSQLSKIVADLEKIATASKNVEAGLRDTGKGIDEAMLTGTKKVDRKLNDVRSLSSRVAHQILGDFKALMSLNALQGALSLSGQFKGSVSEALNLSDTVRRLGHIFGIAKNDFVSFQSRIQKGFGDIGLSSEAAANAIQGLAETPVRGQDNILSFAKTSAQLASVSGEKGNEGGVAKGLVETIQSHAGNVQDPKELARVSREVLQIQTATGKKASEVTAALAALYANTNRDFKKQMGAGGAVTIASAALKGGPGATSFLEHFMSMTKIQRAGMEAQGLGHLIGANGQLDPKAFASTMAEATRRIPMDPEAGLGTMGIQPGEDAKGFMRLNEVLQRPAEADAINGASQKKVDLNQTFDETMGAADNFRASLNKVKSEFSDFISTLTQGSTDLLQHKKNTTEGAAEVVVGGGLIAAILSGMGLQGIGTALGMGGATAAGGAAAATGAGAVAAALPLAAGVTLGAGASKLVQPGGAGAMAKAVGLESLGSKLDQLERIVDVWSGKITGMHSSPAKVSVELKSKDLQKSKPLTRGATY